MLSPQALQEFREIWRKEFGTDIPDDVAVVEALNLLTMFNAIYRPITQGWLDEYETKNKITSTDRQ
jgi:hypothetical protein